MIISALLSLIYSVLDFLLVFNLPSFPATITTLINTALGYMVTGVSVLGALVGHTCMGVIALVLELVIAMNAAYLLYSLVMWVLRKIPMLNVRE